MHCPECPIPGIKDMVDNGQTDFYISSRPVYSVWNAFEKAAKCACTLEEKGCPAIYRRAFNKMRNKHPDTPINKPEWMG